MNENVRERLAAAVLDAIETGAALPPDLGADAPTQRELRALEHAAATVTAALVASEPPMPAALAARLTALGHTMLANRRPAAPAARKRPRPIAMFAFGLAAGITGSALLLAPRPLPDPAQRRARLIEQGTAPIAWQVGPSHRHGEIAGDVVWDASTQQGYLRITGLEPLPADHQYQLWIVDGKREGAPVDGGLFDLGTTGENIVPIAARLPIAEAKAFVVTVEARGGVVVSARDDVVAIAGL